MMRRLWILAPVLTVTAGGLAAQPSEPRESVATSEVVGTMLIVTPQVPYTSAMLRVAGPADYALSKRFPAGTAISADLLRDAEPRARVGTGDFRSLLPDGRYRYEIVLATVSGESALDTGIFFVESGSPVTRDSKRAALAATRRDLAATRMTSEKTGAEGEIGTEAPGFFSDYVGIIDSNFDGKANLTIDSFYYYPDGDRRQSWTIFNTYGDVIFYYVDFGASEYVPRMTLRPDGRVGIGTTTPGTDLHISNSGFSSRIRLAAGASGQNELVNWSDGLFEIAANAGRPLRIFPNAPDNSLVLRPAGVGIGTSAPAAKLHISGSGFTNRMRLQAGAGFRDLVTLGDGGFEIQGAGGGAERAVRIFPAAPDNSLVLHTGGVGIGTASPTAKLHVAGNGRIDGDVALGSSRTVKTAFGTVNPAEVLARVADLPVASWRYKTEDEEERHIGPFAEDFQRLFGLGDGETISVIDAQGVTLAAIQGLMQELAEKDAEIAQLKERLTTRDRELRERIERLERRLEPARED